jgi:hypothetical protein
MTIVKNKVMNVIKKIKFYNEVTIDNFRQIGEPLEKTRSSILSKLCDIGSFEMEFYEEEVVEDGIYSLQDIIDFNKYLWVDKALLVSIKKLLKQIGYKSNPYDIITACFLFRTIVNNLRQPISNVKKEHSVVRLLEFIQNLDEVDLSKRKLVIKSLNLKSHKDFDGESLCFVKKAIENYIVSQEGENYLNQILSEHNSRICKYEDLKREPGENIKSNEKQFKDLFVILLNDFLLAYSRDTRKRLFVIGELKMLFLGQSERYKLTYDKEKFHYDNLRKLI